MPSSYVDESDGIPIEQEKQVLLMIEIGNRNSMITLSLLIQGFGSSYKQKFTRPTSLLPS